MILPKRETCLLGLLALVALIYLGLHFLYQPCNSQLQQLHAENEQMVRELEGVETEIAAPGERAQAELARREEYQQMLVKVPGLPMIPDIIDFLELSAREAQVKLRSISYKESTESHNLIKAEKPADNNPDTRPVNFKIVVDGTYFNLLSLMLKIENAPRLYIINGMKLALTETERVQTATDSKLSGPEANYNTNPMGESSAPESLRYDRNLATLELDFTAFYEPPALNPSTQS